MTVVAGIDGCRGGWLMVRRDPASGRMDFVIFEHWADLPDAEMIAVDMPIGLPDSGERGCDRRRSLTMRLGLIGTGAMACARARAASELDDTELAWVCSRTRRRA